MAYENSCSKAQGFPNPSCFPEAKEKGEAEATNHGDGDAVVVHATESLVVNQIISIQVTKIEFKGDITLAQEDHPGQPPQLADRFNRRDARKGNIILALASTNSHPTAG